MLVTAENKASAVRYIMEADVISLDTETTGLAETDSLFEIIIGTREGVFVFDNRELSNEEISGSLNLALLNPKRIAFQNAKFDVRMCHNFGLQLWHHKWYDIAVGARLLRNDHMLYSLDAQAKRHGTTKKKDIAKEYIQKNNLYVTRANVFGEFEKVPCYQDIPRDIITEYAEADAIATLELYHYYMDRLDEQSIKVWDMESNLTPVVYRMERSGLMLNMKEAWAGYYHELEILNKYKGEYVAATGKVFVNSAKAVQEFLSKSLPLTEEGNPSLTDDIIESILANDPPEKDAIILKLVQNIRHVDKRLSTYYRPLISKAHIHPAKIVNYTLWQAGTRTGRFSSSDPNIQNIPKEEDSTDRYTIRGLFKPRGDRVYVSFDYLQMEYRMMAAYANEKNIIQKVMEGADFHQVTADMFGVTRKEAKTINFAILYGAGTEKLSGMLGVSFQQAELLKTKYFLALPKVDKFVSDVIRTGKQRGYVVNWCGRRMYADRQFCYALPNHLIQGGGADVVKHAMVQIAKEFPDVIMSAQVHDQLVFELTKEECKLIPRIKEIMESQWVMNGMKLEVDIKYSDKSLAERDLKVYEIGS